MENHFSRTLNGFLHHLAHRERQQHPHLPVRLRHGSRDDLDLKPGAPVKKLTLTGGKTYSGDAFNQLIETKLFNFASPDTKFGAPEE